MKELIKLAKIEQDLKRSLEKDLREQREAILKVAKDIDKAIKIKQKEAQKEILELILTNLENCVSADKESITDFIKYKLKRVNKE